MVERTQFDIPDLFITENSDQQNYVSTHGIILSHGWGQRKLLFGKIEALALYWDPIAMPEIIVVYAGAAPFMYSEILHEMYGKIPGTKVEWHLYDPREIVLSSKVQNMTVYQEYFTNETAQRYAGLKNVFFFSDIRTIDSAGIIQKCYDRYSIIRDQKGWPIPTSDKDLVAKAKTEANTEVEDGIMSDMLMQQEWVMIMNPEHAFLKMRLPYIYDSSPEEHYHVQYLAGEVILQAWAKPKSTETRLHPIRNADGKYYLDDWDSKEYESLLAYHNITVRKRNRYFNPLNPTDPNDFDIDPPELYADWDSCAEATILKLYCVKMRVPLEEIKMKVIELSRTITAMLNTKRGMMKTLARLREVSDREDIKNMFQNQKRSQFQRKPPVRTPRK